MLDELKDIERELEKLKKRVKQLIGFLEKRQLRLATLSDEDVIGEAADRTLPATEIAELLGEAKQKKRKR